MNKAGLFLDRNVKCVSCCLKPNEPWNGDRQRCRSLSQAPLRYGESFYRQLAIEIIALMEFSFNKVQVPEMQLIILHQNQKTG